MTKPIRVRPSADREMDALADHIAQASPKSALRFFDAVEKTFSMIAEQPGIGSPRYAHLHLLENLRVWPVLDFEKYLVFYIERPNYIDVLRVLHSSRDIPEVLRKDPEN